jgi:hypothetical protein
MKDIVFPDNRNQSMREAKIFDEKYLDMECLAITGWALSEWLKQRASKY